jgi:predicted ArsR family transcriptional regulator
MSAILRVLAGAAMDSTEIAAKTGLSRRVVMKHLNVLHANGSIYIERWERFGVSGYPARLFAIGSRRDAPRPTARSPGQKWRDRMEDLKKNRPDEYARLLTRRRANAQRRAGRKAMRDIAAQALFGEAAA